MSFSRALKGFRACMVLGILSLAIAATGAFAFTSPALAASYDLYFKNQTTNTDSNVFYGIAGEKLLLVPVVYSLKTYEDVENVTYKWDCAAKLGASVSDDKVTFKKLPGVGKYKVKVSAYSSKGKLLCSGSYVLQVKKNPAIAVKVTKNGSKKNLSSVKKNQMVFLTLKGAQYGWDNNKVFCKWSVKYVKSGKTVSWTTNKWLGNTSIIKNAAEGAGQTVCPTNVVKFKKKGTYKITAKMYHSNKVIAKTTRTLKVK